MIYEAQILVLLRQALSLAVAMSMPLLLTALVTGLVIGLLQALTSIQEMTLTFVPKLGAIVFVFWISASSISRMAVEYFDAYVVKLIIQ